MFALTARCARSSTRLSSPISHSFPSQDFRGRTYASDFTDPKDIYLFRRGTDFSFDKIPLDQKKITIVSEEGLKKIFDEKVHAREEISGIPMGEAAKNSLWNAYFSSVIGFRKRLLSLETQMESKNNAEIQTLLLVEVSVTESERMKMEIFEDVKDILRSLVAPSGNKYEKAEVESFQEVFEKSGVSSEALYKNSLLALSITFQDVFNKIMKIGKVNFSKEGIEAFWQIIAHKRLSELQKRVAVRMQHIQSQEGFVRETLIEEFTKREVLIMIKNTQLELSISKLWNPD